MGRLADWLIGPPEHVIAARMTAGRAGTVALAGPGSPSSRLPWGRGPGLAPIEWNGAGIPWWDREQAMTLPTVARARSLIITAVGALPLTAWQVDYTQAPIVERQIPGPAWLVRPDPNRTRQWLLAWTADDLFFYGCSHWRIVDRYAEPDDYPRSFERITPGCVHLADDGTVTVDGVDHVAARDIVEFLSPIDGLLMNGYRALSIATALDDAADRFAGTEVPAGVLEEQPGGEDLSGEELAKLAQSFTEARRSNTTAATNKYVKYRETTIDASQMQLVEGRQYQALELARLCNVPPYLVGAPTGTGMVYQNAVQAKSDLIDFGALPLIGCIEQTLSGPNVTTGPVAIRLDTNAWLRSPFTGDPNATPPPNDLQLTDPTQRQGPP